MHESLYFVCNVHICEVCTVCISFCRISVSKNQFAKYGLQHQKIVILLGLAVKKMFDTEEIIVGVSHMLQVSVTLF